MRVSIINVDQTIVIDGVALRFPFVLDRDIHAVQWNEDHGEIEYKDPSVPNEVIEDFSPFQYIIDGYNAELLRIEEESRKAEEEAKKEIILIRGVLPEVSEQSLWDRIRAERNSRLSFTDWTQLPGATLTPECVQAFADYRQELRNIPQTYQAPDETLWRADTIHWPVKPEEVKKI